jgi:hypothetical protein
MEGRRPSCRPAHPAATRTEAADAPVGRQVPDLQTTAGRDARRFRDERMPAVVSALPPQSPRSGRRPCWPSRFTPPPITIEAADAPLGRPGSCRHQSPSKRPTPSRPSRLTPPPITIEAADAPLGRPGSRRRQSPRSGRRLCRPSRFTPPPITPEAADAPVGRPDVPVTAT